MAKDLLSSFLPQAEKFPSRPLTLVCGATFGPFYINFFATQPTLVGTYSVNSATDIFTLNAHGMSNDTMVQVAPSGSTTITDGLETGELYFTANVGTNTFQLTTNPRGVISSLYQVTDVKNNVAGKIYKCGVPYNLTNHKVWAWVKAKPTDPDTDILLDLNASITGASFGFGYDWQVTFTKTKTQTFSLSPSSNFWSFLLQFPDGTRSLLVNNSAFTINLPTTHPNLIS